MTKPPSRFALALFALGCFAFLFLIPQISKAHEINFWSKPGYWGPLVSCTGDGSPDANGNATMEVCQSVCDLVHTFQHLIYFGMTLALFVFMPIFVAYGGILILIGGANPGLISQGKGAIQKSIIGAVITLSAFLIVNTFLLAFGQNSGAGTVQFGKFECTPGVNAPPAVKVNFSQKK